MNNTAVLSLDTAVGNSTYNTNEIMHLMTDDNNTNNLGEGNDNGNTSSETKITMVDDSYRNMIAGGGGGGEVSLNSNKPKVTTPVVNTVDENNFVLPFEPIIEDEESSSKSKIEASLKSKIEESSKSKKSISASGKVGVEFIGGGGGGKSISFQSPKSTTGDHHASFSNLIRLASRRVGHGTLFFNITYLYLRTF